MSHTQVAGNCWQSSIVRSIDDVLYSVESTDRRLI
jgi:hypothetical protein